MTYLSLESVDKVYRTRDDDIEAVSNVSFTVDQGQFVSVLGPSGCGKSTLLMMVAGLEDVTRGRIMLAGSVVAGPRVSVGIMFQDPTLLPWKTARENVLFPIRILGRDRALYERRASELLDAVGLADFAQKKPHQLSGGMRQRVAICRALVYDPQVLLMDEPFSALDAITRDEMNQMLVNLWQQMRKTALFVTHSIREAVFLADRVIVMGTRPATIVADVTVPFARPRRPEIGDTLEFNQLCAFLRGRIQHRSITEQRLVPEPAHAAG